MIPVLALIYLGVAFALVCLLRRRVATVTATAAEGA